MTDERRNEQELEALFAAARRDAPTPSADLMARVLADAEAAQAQAQAAPAARPTRPAARPRWRQVVDLLGGWPAMAGLATAGVAGLWLGVAPPAALLDLPLAGFGTADPALVGMLPGVELDLLALEEG